MIFKLYYICLLFKVIRSDFEFSLENWKKQTTDFIEIHKSFRLAIKDIDKKWLNRKIPFLISEGFSAQNKLLIGKAINRFQNTCIQFEPKKEEDRDYIFVTEGNGCNSRIGRQGGPQNLSLGEGCLYLNTIIHELMHSIGFFHEHQRYDRDKHIIINRENIKRGMEFEFNLREKSETTDLDFEYDYNSVMQYEETAFSKNGRPTMESKVKGVKLGPIDGLSQTDIKRLNKYYGCYDNSYDQNNQTVNTLDPNLNCPDLKWISFNESIKQNQMVFGGSDTFANRFYICRAFVSNQLIAGHMFEGMCYLVKSGSELETKEFDVLTHSESGYKWQSLTSNKMLPNSLIIGKGIKTDKNLTDYSIGRCLLKYHNYSCQVVGTIRSNGQSLKQLFVAFNGKQIICNKFEVLLCFTSKSVQIV